MPLRNHNACRNDIRLLFRSDLIRSGYYVQTEDGKPLEFSVIYNPTEDETPSKSDFTAAITEDMVEDEVLTDKFFELECVGMTPYLEHVSYLLKFKVHSTNFIRILVKDNAPLKYRIIQKLSDIKACVLESNAMVIPQLGNKIITGDYDLTFMERIELGCVFDKDNAEVLKNAVETRIVREWMTEEKFEPEGWEYVVSVEGGSVETDYILKVYARKL